MNVSHFPISAVLLTSCSSCPFRDLSCLFYFQVTCIPDRLNVTSLCKTTSTRHVKNKNLRFSVLYPGSLNPPLGIVIIPRSMGLSTWPITGFYALFCTIFFVSICLHKFREVNVEKITYSFPVHTCLSGSAKRMVDKMGEG